MNQKGDNTMSVDDLLLRQIEDAKQELSEDKSVSKDRKDALLLRLCHAQSIANGDPESIDKALSFMMLDSVRESIRNSENSQRLVQEHATKCAFSRSPKNAKEFVQNIAAQYPILTFLGCFFAADKIGWDKIGGVIASIFKG